MDRKLLTSFHKKGMEINDMLLKIEVMRKKIDVLMKERDEIVKKLKEQK